MDKKLYRSNRNKVLAGVCGGIAEYFEIDPTIVRIIWLICTLPGGIGLIAYIICWVAMPAKATDYVSPFEEQQHQTAGDSEKSKRILGIALIVIGATFLLDRFFLWFDLNIIIPLGIIIVGLIILFNARK
ncbi:MAG: PspC domain-containing protein [Peptococcaceae bacterium]|jgi:phage shock protein C|nr:PspC domain-containing protein [Peptococcaceae bacterium]